MPPATDASSPAKTKTKAKLRYLKAKKTRKKKRKATTTQAPKQGTSAHDELDDEDEDEDDEDEEGDGTTSSDETISDEEMAIVEEEAPALPPVETIKEKRPKKKRKTDNPPTDEQDAQMEEPLPPPDMPMRNRSPTPPSTLPSFPLPKQPELPSPEVLSLQGLDKALLEAEIVDPDRVMSIPEIEDDNVEDMWMGLSNKTKRRLKELNIVELFAVQTALLPFLLPSTPRRPQLYLPYDPPQDVCVSAPTGSGKTLAYVLPIVETLSTRIITRLRALIVLPTRDLTTQVRETFESLSKGRGLKIGVVTGQHSFAQEQAQLAGDSEYSLQGGSSKIDILICTPGRLMDHINGTPNFTLQHLRFLVIDEADRLITQAFQDWLAQVLAATKPSPPRPSPSSDEPALSLLPYPDALAPAFLHLSTKIPHIQTDIDEPKEPSCQKLLFSATLTRDPSRIAALNLRDPKYFVIKTEDGVMGMGREEFAVPSTLKEHMLIAPTSLKPLLLFHLIHTKSITNALIFTKSTESTNRLVMLFEFFETARVGSGGQSGGVIAKAYSSDLNPSDRKSILQKFKSAEIGLLISSDLISRGMDINHVSHVINYDTPIDIRKYIHRVGRTARAGREGDAWTLVEEQEARHFKQMMNSANRLDKVKKMKVPEKDLNPLKPHYQNALQELKKVYSHP